MKYALVTGSTKGIGKEVGLALLKEGYFVFFNYANGTKSANDLAEDLREYQNFSIIKADLSNYETIDMLVKKISSVTENLDCIILNSGMTYRAAYEEIDYEEWQKVMNCNINIPFFILQKLDYMLEDNARIIFTGALLGIVPHATSIVYGVSKAAVHHLAKNLVKIYKDRNITVNVIAPGFVDTEWQKSKDIEHRKRIENKIALKRFGTVEEIADLYMSVINNPYINGAVINIDGGYDTE